MLKKNFQKDQKKEDGFTLLEILLSVTLLTIFVIGSSQVGTYLRRSASVNENNKVALQVMEKKMAEYKLLTPSALKALTPGAQVTTKVNQLKKLDGNPAQLFTFITELENDKKCREFNLKVEWNDYAGRPKSEYLSSVIYAD